VSGWKDDRNKRAIAIPRVSSKRQGDNLSHDVQASEIEEYCRQHGLQLVKSFKLTESAKRAVDRKQYRAAIDFALTEGVRHLLFYVQDRESRNLRDLEDNEQHVKDGKLVIHYVRDRKVLDQTTTESDFFNRDIQGAMNKNYSRVLAGKVKDAQRAKAENGWFPGGRLPLGYVHLRPKDEQGREVSTPGRAGGLLECEPLKAV
jgi:site-specific DNA recombinase